MYKVSIKNTFFISSKIIKMFVLLVHVLSWIQPSVVNEISKVKSCDSMIFLQNLSRENSLHNENSKLLKLNERDLKTCFCIQYGITVTVKINIERDHSSKYFLLKIILVFK